MKTGWSQKIPRREKRKLDGELLLIPQSCIEQLIAPVHYISSIDTAADSYTSGADVRTDSNILISTSTNVDESVYF